MQQRRILVAVTGGIAAYKVPELIRALVRAGHATRAVMTREATEFTAPLVLQTLTGEPVHTALFDSSQEGEIDHIELADWAELLLIAPATANTLAKLAHGLADDLVSAIALATRAPILVAPAMNVNMWEHPATVENLVTLRARGVRTVGPDTGQLACGWEGAGRMSDPAEIALTAELVLGSRTLESEAVLVTAAGTREAVDAVRYLGNRSSGKMGFAVATEAARRGARVTLVTGPSSLPTPVGVQRIDVESALEMRAAVLAAWPDSTIAIKTAAVADFRPAHASALKIRKEDLDPDAGLTLELVRNPDILAEISKDRGDRVVVGFAAESHDVIESARRKLARKGCDLLVANDISREGIGFDSDSNAVVFVWPGGEIQELPILSKAEVAARLLDHIEKLREGHK